MTLAIKLKTTTWILRSNPIENGGITLGRELKRSGKFGQRSKMYSNWMNGY
jgi:hypothetical protein